MKLKLFSFFVQLRWDSGCRHQEWFRYRLGCCLNMILPRANLCSNWRMPFGNPAGKLQKACKGSTYPTYLHLASHVGVIDRATLFSWFYVHHGTISVCDGQRDKQKDEQTDTGRATAAAFTALAKRHAGKESHFLKHAIDKPMDIIRHIDHLVMSLRPGTSLIRRAVGYTTASTNTRAFTYIQSNPVWFDWRR